MHLRRALTTGLTGLMILFNICITVSTFWASPFSKYLNGHDSSMFLYFGTGMMHGLVPYNDMFDHKGIVLFWIQQFGVWLGHSNYSLGIWVVEVCFYLVTVICVLAVIKRLTNNPLAGGLTLLLSTPITVVTYNFGNYCEEYAVAFIAIALLLTVAGIQKNRFSRLSLFGIGVTGALTFFIRANMVALWGLICLGLLLYGLRRRQYRQLAQQAGWIFLGGIGVCLAVLTYALIHGNLHQMIYQTFTLNAEYAGASGWSARWSTAKQFVKLTLTTGQFWLMVALVMMTLVRIKQLTKRELWLRIELVGFAGLNFLTVILSGRYYPHYFVTMLPVITVLGAIALNDIMKLQWFVIGKGALIVILVLTPVLAMHRSTIPTWQHVNLDVGNKTLANPMVAEARYIDAHSTSKTKIYAHRTTANLYLMTNRFSSTRFFTLPDLDYRHFSGLKEEFIHSFSSQKPQFVAIYKDVFLQPLPTDRSLDRSVISILKSQYQIVPKFSHTSVLLFERN